MEEEGTSKNFQKYLGRFRAVEGITFVIAALVGGFIATTFELRDTYLISLPLIAVALIFLWKFKEPRLHKAEVADPVFTHIRQTFAAVLRNPTLLPVVVATVGFMVFQEIIFEFSQLWFIAVAAPIALYGVFNAAVFSSWTTGGLLAARLKSKGTTVILMVVLLAMSVLLALAKDHILVLVAQVVLAVCLVALAIVLAKKMHDELPSRLRAGSSSVISTIARIIIIPGSLVFTGVANVQGMPVATYMLVGVAVLSVVAYGFIGRGKKTTA